MQRVVVAPIRKFARRDDRMVDHDAGEREGAVADIIHHRHAEAELVDARQGRCIGREVFRIANGDAARRDDGRATESDADMLDANLAADRGGSLQTR